MLTLGPELHLPSLYQKMLKVVTDVHGKCSLSRHTHPLWRACNSSNPASQSPESSSGLSLEVDASELLGGPNSAGDSRSVSNPANTLARSCLTRASKRR